MVVQEEKKEENNNFRSTLAQALATFGICQLSFNVGMILCMITIVIGALRMKDSSIPLTESQASWFGSLLFITQPFGCLCSGLTQDLLGRKLCLVLINLPILIAWLVIFFSSTVAHLYCAMVLFGLSLGFMEAPVLSYIGEVTQPRLRGVLSCGCGVFFNLGFMFETLLGAELPWRTMVVWSAVSPVLGFFVMALLPESPAWLVSKGRVREAERSYRWLRGWSTKEAVSRELQDMVAYVKETQGTEGLYSGDYKPVATLEGTTPETPRLNKFQIILEPGVLKGLRIVFIYFAIMSSAGLFAMRPFFIEILNNLKLPISSHHTVVICGALQAVGAVGVGFILQPLGKRGVTFLSLSICTFCCLGIGLYLASGLSYAWLPVSLFALSYFGTSFGISCVPWILTMELFPLRARGLASGLCGAFSYVSLFLVIKTYYTLEAWLGVSGTCFFYGTIGILGFVYLYLDLPETEGVALEEIERRMSERGPRKQTSTGDMGR